MITTFLTIWVSYLVLGIWWGFRYVNKRNLVVNNVVGFLMLVICWPFHMTYEIIRYLYAVFKMVKRNKSFQKENKKP